MDWDIHELQPKEQWSGGFTYYRRAYSQGPVEVFGISGPGPRTPWRSVEWIGTSMNYSPKSNGPGASRIIGERTHRALWRSSESAVGLGSSPDLESVLTGPCGGLRNQRLVSGLVRIWRTPWATGSSEVRSVGADIRLTGLNSHGQGPSRIIRTRTPSHPKVLGAGAKQGLRTRHNNTDGRNPESPRGWFNTRSSDQAQQHGRPEPRKSSGLVQYKVFGPGTTTRTAGTPKVLGAGSIQVGGAICLVDSDNERDSPLLNSYAAAGSAFNFLEGQVAFSHARRSDNRSVMPLDVRGCTRATMGGSVCVYPAPRGAGNPLNPALDRDRGLQLFPTNEEFPVGAGHEPASIKSLPFVHTARRYYRSDGLARSSDRPRRGSSRALAERREVDRT
ncbi:hypothetical protein E1301_Tti021959 [Triplophysa tibetana]|uniref:Uncharacterized protein n=1 Tax=Triplophysa tibetana TaxID=1572043 RepID=A0A5A9PHA3_9TELE|nr:hypothetical protein E1301_Tti021959 [Triplophysa tibetana]